MTTLSLVIFVFCIKMLVVNGHYNRAYIEDLCDSDRLNVWNLGSGNSNSSGILRTARFKDFLKGKNCTVVIQPPLGYGVILSIRLLDFRPYYPSDCKSYVEVSDDSKSIKLCGYSDDLSEYQSYFSEGKAMKLNFVTVNESGSQYHSDIVFVATSYVKFSYSCELKMFQCENSRCIWKGLTCDGHNNCGDQSDEFSHRKANCGMLSPGSIAAIIVGSIMTFIVLVVVPFACVRYCCKSRNRESEPPLLQPDPIYRSNVGEGNIQQTEDSQQPSSSYGRYRDLPPAYKP